MSIYNTIKEIYNDTSKITGNVNAHWKIVGLLKRISIIFVCAIYLLEKCNFKSVLTNCDKIQILFPSELSNFLSSFTHIIIIIYILYSVIIRNFIYIVLDEINYIKEKDWFPVWYTIDVIVEILFYSVINLKLIQDILLCLKGQNVIQDMNVYIYLFVIVASLWDFVETIYKKNKNRCEYNKIKYTKYFDSDGNRIAVSDQVVYKNKIYKIYMVNGEWYLSDINRKEDIKLGEAICDVSGKLKVYSWEMGRRGYINNA